MNASAMSHHDLVTYMDQHKEELTAKEQGFVKNCVKDLRKYPSLTWKMHKWASSIVHRVMNKDVQSAYDKLPSLKGVFDIFATAADNLKFPKITFDTDNLGVIRIQRAGAKSKYTGQLMITDGRRFGDNRWYGRIDLDGNMVAGMDVMTDPQIKFLERFSKDPVAIAREYAKESGHCCFCNKELTDKKSTSKGYGPVCAENYGLPWGKK